MMNHTIADSLILFASSIYVVIAAYSWAFVMTAPVKLFNPLLSAIVNILLFSVMPLVGLCLLTKWSIRPFESKRVPFRKALNQVCEYCGNQTSLDDRQCQSCGSPFYIHVSQN